MATIVIKDLSESVELDREAMLAITGGARMRGRPSWSGPTLLRQPRIVDYPPGLPAGALTGRWQKLGDSK